MDAAKFGYYLSNGQAVKGTRIVTVSGDTVTVGFATGAHATGAHATGAHATVGKAVREAVAPAAVTNLVGESNTPGSTGKKTSVPDVVSATLPTSKVAQVKVTFDGAITTSATAHKFVAYAADGHPYKGSVAVVAGKNSVDVGFPGLTNDGKAISRIAVLDGAVHATTASTSGAKATGTGTKTSPNATGTGNATKVSNTIGAVSVKGASKPPTPAAGPVLTSAATLGGGRAVRYTFSTPIELMTSCIPSAKPAATTVHGAIAGTTSATGSTSTTGTTGFFTLGTTGGHATAKGSSATSTGNTSTASATAGGTSTKTCNASAFEVVAKTGKVVKGAHIAAYATQGSAASENSVIVTFPATAKIPGTVTAGKATRGAGTTAKSTTSAAFSVTKGAVTGVMGVKNAPMTLR